MSYLPSEDLTPKMLQQTVMEWVEIMDQDQSGRIELPEFYEFFSSLDDMPLTDDQVQGLFNSFDRSGDGVISVEEFARAVQACLSRDHAVQFGNPSGAHDHQGHGCDDDDFGTDNEDDDDDKKMK